ncbi:peptidylprolyl isomerase [Sulfitobacter sp. TSTF-M16]|uniref:Parvulin-like PPIase n=1 Tax=Sulfitobacter aestuariivivens TaxID=2766981 RepID=A0A927D4Q8_9RHOB|nr:peptidylprolyl isomerase [Sulfitobacter aestuariivivens]MBD3663392.1 peptidylprolyl isomerase [Sulfitobacter aestuariivivens]
MSELKPTPFALLIRTLAVLSIALLLGHTAAAQNLFAPVARVDSAVVTEYEVQQRQRFLQLLNAPGSDRESVIDALIDDRLRIAETSLLGVELPAEAQAQGLAEFAARANLTTEEFVTALGQAGVDRETFRDFVSTQLIWRDLIRARYSSRVSITDDDIDRALAQSQSGSGVRVLLSEIIIPAPPQNAARVNALADQISQTRSTAEFSSFARRYSATASRGRGGQLPWTPLEQLPPSLQPLILQLAVGQVTPPLPIPNAVALFQLRGIEETGAPAREYSEIEYAAYYIAGGRSEAALAEAAKVRARVDTCNDLYGIAQGQPEEVLERGTKAPGDIPQDIAIELSKLDPGESSTALTRSNGETLVFLMLCKRTAAANAEVDRETVVSSLRQRQLQGYSEQLLENLRANARIIRQ